MSEGVVGPAGGRRWTEARTVRDARLEIRQVEGAAERVHMAPATALSWRAEWYLRKARLALRQAERAFAKTDDPRLEPLEAMRPQVRERRPSTRPRRRRYRCPQCFFECLLDPAYGVEHRRCGVDMEPVARRTPRKGVSEHG